MSQKRLQGSSENKKHSLSDTTMSITETPDYSDSHCIGENFQENGWYFRTCHVKNLCFDTTNNEFTVFTTPQQQALLEMTKQDPFVYISTVTQTASLASIDLNTGTPDPWSPSQRYEPLSRRYQFQDNVIWVPFKSFSDRFETFLWDDMFPIFTALSSFGLLDADQIILTDLREDASIQNIQWNMIRLTRQQELKALSNEPLLCASNAIYGIGMISNYKAHEKRWFSGNNDLIPLISQFQNFIRRHIGMSDSRDSKSSKLILVSLLQPSSSDRVVREIQGSVAGNEIQVQALTGLSQPLLEQMQQALQSSMVILENARESEVLLSMMQRDSLVVFLDGKCDQGRAFWNLMVNVGYLHCRVASSLEDAIAIVREASSRVY